MADFGGALVGLADCFVFPVCSGVLKVTFFFVDMVSIATGVVASFGTLNLMMPNLSDVGYDNKIGRLVVSSHTWNMTCMVLGRVL